MLYWVQLEVDHQIGDHVLFLSLSLAFGSVLKFLLGSSFWPDCH